MNKLTLVFSMLALMLLGACNKVSGPGTAGTWTFGGSSYNAANSSRIFGTISATSTVGGNGASVLSVDFFGDSIPTAGGTFIVNGDSAQARNQVGIALSTNNGANAYWPTGNGSQTVTVNISGKTVSITGQAIELKNVFPAGDSALLNFTITQ